MMQKAEAKEVKRKFSRTYLGQSNIVSVSLRSHTLHQNKNASDDEDWFIAVGLSGPTIDELPSEFEGLAVVVELMGSIEAQSSTEIKKKINRERILMSSRLQLSSELNLSVSLIPESNAHNRPGTKLNVSYITIHNTGNDSRGADANAHINFLRKGYYIYEGKRYNVSWHFTVDDGAVVQHLPLDEVAYHAKSGNSKSLGIEICMNQGIDQDAANDRAALLAATLLHDFGLDIDRLVTHEHWTGKECPIKLLDSWDGFKRLVENELARLKGARLLVARPQEVAISSLSLTDAQSAEIDSFDHEHEGMVMAFAEMLLSEARSFLALTSDESLDDDRPHDPYVAPPEFGDELIEHEEPSLVSDDQQTLDLNSNEQDSPLPSVVPIGGDSATSTANTTSASSEVDPDTIEGDEPNEEFFFPDYDIYEYATYNESEDAISALSLSDYRQYLRDFRQFIDDLNLQHFSASEFLTKGGTNSNPNHPCFDKNGHPPKSLWDNVKPLARAMDAIRTELGVPVRLTSVYRNQAYNGCLGGTARRSMHMQFKAADFQVQGKSSGEVARVAKHLRSRGVFSGGIGIYNTFVHIDVRGYAADWDKRN